MNICMIVHNSGTRDGRVMREAHTLQAAGHAVTVLGITEPGRDTQQEFLSDGIRVLRVPMQRWRMHLLLRGLPRLLAFVAICSVVAYGLSYLWREISGAAPKILWALIVLFGIGLGTVLLWKWQVRPGKARRGAGDEERIRQILSGNEQLREGQRFPAIRSRIPEWLPDWLLEIVMEPFSWIGAPKFSLYRYRSERLAAAAIRLKPDVVHCHDCAALPTGGAVKRALGIPLIYDAHEIYEAVAARRAGAIDYFARVHQRWLPGIDGFVAVNDSAASYYRLAYPAAPRAVVIRNATERLAAESYDGRLHRAANLAASEKILLYQGGFTRHRGLETLVRSAALLPKGWSLVMMGWGPLLQTLTRIAAEQGSAEKVRFLKSVPAAELLTWTQGATVGIVPYEDVVLNHWIATPNKLWEYPNAGVPMIVQPFPEMRRIVENYGCGWVLPANFTPGAIAELVGSLTDAGIAEARAGCFRFVAQDNWTDLYGPRLLGLYEGIEQTRSESASERGNARLTLA